MAKITVLTGSQRLNQDILSSIRIKKPYIVNDNIHVFDISHNNHALAIQTTACVIPYSHYIFDNKSFQLDIHSCDSNVRDLMCEINNHIISRIKKYNNTILTSRMFLDYVKDVRQDSRGEYRIRLRNINVNNVSVFDVHNNNADIATLQTFDRVVCLFQLQKLIVQKETYYFQASVVQIKKLNTPLLVIRDCMIHHVDDSGDDVTLYDKMKKVGVPTEAINHKKKMEQTEQLHHQHAQLLAQIKRVVEISPAIENEVVRQPETTRQQQPSPPKETPTMIFHPPSLSDILKARTKLRPISS